MRTGLIARKLGMTRLFTEDGNHIPVTVLKVENCQVVAQRTVEKDGYSAMQVGVGAPKVKNMTKAMRGHFAKAKVEPKARLGEFRVGADHLQEVGTEITVDHFIPGQFVDVSGTTIGKGFAGAMKRHGFIGGPATHGSKVHRQPMSSGATDPARVIKGTKKPGHMGSVRNSVMGLKVVQVDANRNLLLVKGAVPGANGGLLIITAT